MGLALERAREAFHAKVVEELYANRGLYGTAGRAADKREPPVPSSVTSEDMLPLFAVADSHNEDSARIAEVLADELICSGTRSWRFPSKAASKPTFEDLVAEYVANGLELLGHLHHKSLRVLVLQQRGAKRPPVPGSPPDRLATLGTFQAYRHLWYLAQLTEQIAELRAAFGGDYLIRPDIVVWRWPYTTEELNGGRPHDLARDSDEVALLSPVWQRWGGPREPILHASVSVKWTIRTDRAQNVRTEALNVIRNRKGRVPHMVFVTMEPLPSRLLSISQGTGDLDCAYHGALYELRRALERLADARPDHWRHERAVLEALVQGHRLRDISDLPLDLLL